MGRRPAPSTAAAVWENRRFEKVAVTGVRRSWATRSKRHLEACPKILRKEASSKREGRFGESQGRGTPCKLEASAVATRRV